MARWDPEQYARYADERSRPFRELVARVGAAEPRHVVDLGCGSGELTASLLDRWPSARVVGVDSSAEMVAAAATHAVDGRLSFVQADAAAWRPDQPVDVVVSNALLQWVPDHLDLLTTIAGWLAPQGWLAFQVPDNFDAPSHTLLRDLRSSPRWRDRLGAGADRGAAVERPERYLRALQAAGLEVDVWQTTYLHVLVGEDPVLEWVKGTALRPVLSVLDQDEQRQFLGEYGAQLRAAYPGTENGTVFPFRRTFAVGHL
ncbi:MAG TPA: trans-aconitate 2-methyltransferase [Mycobacteriales bacterium]|nr:trans-aconitate 2-methyltransferase [Mycobacteriales bacterium]